MIQKIIADTAQMEKELVVAEQQAQAAYEAFVKDTNESVAAASKDVVSKSEAKAKAEEDKIATEQDHASTMSDLEKLEAYHSDLISSCDFVMKNFEIRQEARDQEIEALKQAKAILSGADF